MGKFRRRQFLVAAGALAAAPLVRAQDRLPKIGFLIPNPRPAPADRASNPVRQRMNQLGWIDGKSNTYEVASADGHEDRLPALAAELVAKNVDVIWVAGPEAAVAAARATKTIPIAFYGVGNPVELGLVESLAKPGGNVTGLASGTEAWPKGLELLQQLAPGRARLAYIGVETVMSTVSGERVHILDDTIESGARRLGMEYRRWGIWKREDLDEVFAAIREAGSELLYGSFTALTFRERHRIAGFATRQGLPSAFGAAPFVEAGGLVSYGPNRMGMILDSLNYLDRILRGARPADLPVELPRKFDLTVNLKTAKALGLSVPQSILLRADRVIE